MQILKTMTQGSEMDLDIPDNFEWKLSESDLITNPRRIVEREGSSHHHFFGGKRLPEFEDPQPEAKLHLLFDLDLGDPRLRFLGFKGIERLPLLFPFRHEAGELSYSVTEKGIRVHHVTPPETLPGWPYEGYPDAFERRSVDIEPVAYEAQKTFFFAARYTSNSFSNELLSIDDARLLEQYDYPFPQVGGLHYTPGGDPPALCYNWACPRKAIDVPAVANGDMMLAASLGNRPFKGVSLWSHDEEGYADSVYIRYYLCQFCLSIYTSAAVGS